jgi:cobalamin-dependent methionine synthase I
MTKRDLNYIKVVKQVVKQEQIDVGYQRRRNEMHRIPSIIVAHEGDREKEHKERCQEAAKMTPYARLVYYAGTGDATYIGSGCNWDLRTQLGYNQRLGGL